MLINHGFGLLFGRALGLVRTPVYGVNVYLDQLHEKTLWISEKFSMKK